MTNRAKRAESVQSDTQTDNTIRFPTADTYTAVAIAEELGCHPDTVRKRWFPEIADIYQTCAEKLKQGHFYSQIAHDEFVKRQRYRDSERPLLNSKGTIVRHEPEQPGKLGLPVMESNSSPMTKREYREMRWRENPELKSNPREDSVEAAEAVEAELVSDGAIAPYTPPPVHDAEFVDQFNGTLDTIEDMGDSINNFLSQIQQVADTNADMASAHYWDRFAERFNQNLQKGQEAMGKAMNGRRKSAQNTK